MPLNIRHFEDFKTTVKQFTNKSVALFSFHLQNHQRLNDTFVMLLYVQIITLTSHFQIKSISTSDKSFWLQRMPSCVFTPFATQNTLTMKKKHRNRFKPMLEAAMTHNIFQLVTNRIFLCTWREKMEYHLH